MLLAWLPAMLSATKIIGGILAAKAPQK